jgi:Ca2+-transporting ATPase
LAERRGAESVLLRPHATDAGAVAAALGADLERGLEESEATRRAARAGPNQLEEPTAPPLWQLIWDSASEPFILLLFGAGLLAVLLGETRDGLLVLVGLVPIVGADVVTQYRAERALEALRAASAPMARVRRDGEPRDVPAAELVPGDVVLLREGDVVPADLRLAEALDLLLDRSALTGESIPEPGSVVPDPQEAPLADRRSMAYSGTAVVGGTGVGIVTATGRDTELGRIAASLAPTQRRRSPVQRELDRLVRILLAAAIGLIAVTVGLGFARGGEPGENLLAGISAAIAAIPEEPPILLAVVLGLGAYRLLRRGVLVRRLNAQETLGAVDLILTDKTGTLTENRLELASALTPEGPLEGNALDEALADGIRAEADAWHALSGTRPGSFTRALMSALQEREALPSLDARDLLEADPPDDTRPYSRTLTESGELALGAPEAVLALCEDLFQEDAEAWHSSIAEQGRAGGRTLLLARRPADGEWEPVALLVFADRLRPDITDAMAMARGAGIQAVMVTGDHPTTAATIARQAGLEAARVVTGPELDTWSDERLQRELAELNVVARAVPEQKLRLVEAARRLGRTVAVTGDGVNDAPALHRADVAVAMGSGTQVAREAADLVLGDDSFATLMGGLREGRRMVENIRKGLVFLVSTHVALLGFILIATLAGHAQPLLPLQILWLELFIDLSASVAFEREREEPGAMQRPPRPRDVPLIPSSLLARIGAAGGFTAVAALVLLQTDSVGGDHARWLAYTALVVGQVVRAYSNRSLGRSILGLGTNGFLAATAILVVCLQIAIPLVPPLADAFRAVPLTPGEWALVAGVALFPAVVADVIRRLGYTWVG